VDGVDDAALCKCRCSARSHCTLTATPSVRNSFTMTGTLPSLLLLNRLRDDDDDDDDDMLLRPNQFFLIFSCLHRMKQCHCFLYTATAGMR
jgi:hypothetical protein